MLENIYVHVVLEKFPESLGFPEELRHTQWWYVADTPEFDWTTDIRKAKKFESKDAAENYMRSGAVSSKFCGNLDGFACHVCLYREHVQLCRMLSVLEEQ